MICQFCDRFSRFEIALLVFVEQESGVELCSVEIESYKDDPERIEKMTVQELRTTLR